MIDKEDLEAIKKRKIKLVFILGKPISLIKGETQVITFIVFLCYLCLFTATIATRLTRQTALLIYELRISALRTALFI